MLASLVVQQFVWRNGGGVAVASAMIWYYKLLAHRPHLVLLLTGVLCVACIIVSLTKKIPDFSDPTLGFEARGTELGQRMTAWHNLLDETSPLGGQLVANPYENFDDDYYPTSGKKKHNAQRHRNNKKRKNKNKGKNKGALVLTEKIQRIKSANNFAAGKAVNSLPEGSSDETTVIWAENTTRREEEDAWEYGRNVSFIDDEDEVNKTIMGNKDLWKDLKRPQPPLFQTEVHSSSDGFFCNSPSKLF